MQLPTILSAYFDAVNAADTAAMAVCFASDAVVQDEGETHRGIAAVTQWVETTTEKYQVSAQVLKVEQRGSETIVTCKISGTFDGSPIELHYHFTLANDRIAALAVQG